ncbi:fasciclin-like arabinogalactan protein 12 [Magnolia sinica]|uniref:fasciclin-like arabinogalactan protein 12 n=1 Tax=Magnolia sinica TaxID=86752 RepID=UPI002658DAE7|nr:fasciclin-like arabinogalactan protein 12 [Magnolia sinica]
MERLSLVFSFTIALFQILQTVTVVTAQSPAPAPAGPTNITAILEKAGQYTTFIRLLKSTAVADQINSQLNNTNNGMTLFAPTDNSFSSLKSGTLNSLTDQEKISLIQFHVISSYIPLSQFQTATNPLRTQAGDVSNYAFPLNVSTAGNQVNFTTGIDNATIANTIYTDGQLVVYQIDKVLLPLSIFGPHPPAPAPAPSKPKKASRSSASPSSDDASSALYVKVHALESFAVAAAAIAAFWL